MRREKELLYAYLAGIVDGEGSISIQTSGKVKQFTTKLTVTNTNYEMIQLFEQEFGGKVRQRVWKTAGPQDKLNWKPCYEWTLIHQKAASAVELLYPHLRIKKRQAILLLRLNRLKRRYNGAKRRWDKELNAKCLRVYGKLKARCKALNQRGLSRRSS